MEKLRCYHVVHAMWKFANQVGTSVTSLPLPAPGAPPPSLHLVSYEARDGHSFGAPTCTASCLCPCFLVFLRGVWPCIHFLLLL